MIALKCKMCGGDLSVSPAHRWHLPVLRHHHDPARHRQHAGGPTSSPVPPGLRQGDEFDRASEVYLRLLEANPRDAEAHWGMVLCRFGIAYVEDPETGRRLPTCNRVRFGLHPGGRGLSPGHHLGRR